MSVDILHKSNEDLRFENYILLKNTKNKALELFKDSLTTNTNENIIFKENSQENIEYETWTIYILILDTHKLYVGIAKDYIKRIEQHKKHKGARYTCNFKNIELLDDIQIHFTKDNAEKIEEFLTFRLMECFGYQNIRGGKWTKKDYKKDITLKKENINKYKDPEIGHEFNLDDEVEYIYKKICKKYTQSQLIEDYNDILFNNEVLQNI
jgi:predicted GIY-YIG superfamily endonuclease